jgi:hypothetical protein
MQAKCGATALRDGPMGMLMRRTAQPSERFVGAVRGHRRPPAR